MKRAFLTELRYTVHDLSDPAPLVLPRVLPSVTPEQWHDYSQALRDLTSVTAHCRTQWVSGITTVRTLYGKSRAALDLTAPYPTLNRPVRAALGRLYARGLRELAASTGTTPWDTPQLSTIEFILHHVLEDL